MDARIPSGMAHLPRRDTIVRRHDTSSSSSSHLSAVEKAAIAVGSLLALVVLALTHFLHRYLCRLRPLIRSSTLPPSHPPSHDPTAAAEKATGLHHERAVPPDLESGLAVDTGDSERPTPNIPVQSPARASYVVDDGPSLGQKINSAGKAVSLAPSGESGTTRASQMKRPLPAMGTPVTRHEDPEDQRGDLSPTTSSVVSVEGISGEDGLEGGKRLTIAPLGVNKASAEETSRREGEVDTVAAAAEVVVPLAENTVLRREMASLSVVLKQQSGSGLDGRE